MKKPWARGLVGLLAPLVLTGGAAAAGHPTFQERVQAQRAIERVYYSHQIDATRPFEEAVPHELLVRKVRAYLDRSDALEKVRRAPITRDALRAEWERISRDTRMPERFEELSAALGHDPLLIQECLVRPVLAERLLREKAAEAAVPAGTPPDPRLATGTEALTSGCTDGAWVNGSLANHGPLSGRSGHTAVWTGNVMIVWGGAPYTNTGARYDPVLDAWTPTSLTGAPPPRAWHTAVWTGSLMIVWGGFGSSGRLGSGGRYDPIADSWTPTAPPGLAEIQGVHKAVWTGSRMFIWSNWYYTCFGARYDPVADSWTPVSLAGASCGAGEFALVWTGSEAIVWQFESSTGAKYDPVADTWTPISTAGAPYPRAGAEAAWTGSRMVVMGGYYLDECEPYGVCRTYLPGGRYDPVADAWSASGLILERQGFSVVWTGAHLLFWGGSTCTGNCQGSYLPYNDGWFYDPLTDQTIYSFSIGAPSPRDSHTAVWTGNSMIVWGGRDCASDCPDLDTGGRFVEGGVPDDDGDGFGTGCDCDDASPAVYPGAPQICDGLNNDCLAPGWPDPAGTNETDEDLDSFTECAGDCNDHNAQVHPGAIDVCDGVDNDCSGRADEPFDLDADGSATCLGDCDDTRSTVHPGAPQICGDGLNNNCLAVGWPSLAGTNEFDDDLDAFSECQGDCDDARYVTYPGAPQLCDGINTDCSDPAWPSVPPAELNADGDGFRVCQGDCDDTRSSVYPGAPQRCDGLNNNCSDPEWPAVPRGEEDADRDGSRPCSGECDDTRATVYPRAPQICDGLNNDCSDPEWPSLAGTNEMDDDGDLQTECAGDCNDAAANVYTGAPQICDGINTDCADPYYPALPPGELDSDGDGYRRCAGQLPADCFDGNATVWARPGDVQDMVWVNQDMLTWSPPDPPGGTSFRFSQARAASPGNFVANTVCLDSSGSIFMWTEDLEIPAEGAIFFYLVRGGNACGYGPWGYGSSGGEVPVRNCP